MERINKYVGGACYLLLILLCLFYYSETARLQKLVSAQEVVIDTNKKVIEALQEDQRRINRALVDRQCSIDRLKSELATYEHLWQEEKNKDPMVVDWAAQPIPFSAVRLLKTARGATSNEEPLDPAEPSSSNSDPRVARKEE